MVDDLFLTTTEFLYDGQSNEGTVSTYGLYMGNRRSDVMLQNELCSHELEFLNSRLCSRMGHSVGLSIYSRPNPNSVGIIHMDVYVNERNSGNPNGAVIRSIRVL